MSKTALKTASVLALSVTLISQMVSLHKQTAKLLTLKLVL